MSAVTIYGVCAVSFMMVMYALEPRGRGFVLAFAAGCLLSSAYGFLSGAWPFGVIQPFRVRVARPRGDRRCGSGLRRAGLRPGRRSGRPESKARRTRASAPQAAITRTAIVPAVESEAP
jgi:hypothetical protein